MVERLLGRIYVGDSKLRSKWNKQLLASNSSGDLYCLKSKSVGHAGHGPVVGTQKDLSSIPTYRPKTFC